MIIPLLSEIKVQVFCSCDLTPFKMHLQPKRMSTVAWDFTYDIPFKLQIALGSQCYYLSPNKNTEALRLKLIPRIRS